MTETYDLMKLVANGALPKKKDNRDKPLHPPTNPPSLPSPKTSDEPTLLALNKDLQRTHLPPTNSPSPNTSDEPTLPALIKYLTISPQNNTWLRLFLPTNPNPKPFAAPCSAASTMFHDFWQATSAALLALIAYVEYLFGPKHCLTVVYEDAAEALTFIRNGNAAWRKEP
ncbi:hypothetical protein Fmac_021301 [Flemingia macrophylla]|uniref:Uncharacterized protein n=1 Tax=Flemingia macrophylla TaxID=520843 RepID=A0ABD1LWG1_9FABA